MGTEGTDLLLVLLLVAGPTLARAAPGGRGGPAACTTGGAAAAAEVPAGAGVVTGAARDVAEHVVHESALLGDAVVEVSRDVHLASAVRGLLKEKWGRLNNMSSSHQGKIAGLTGCQRQARGRRRPRQLPRRRRRRRRRRDCR